MELGGLSKKLMLLLEDVTDADGDVGRELGGRIVVWGRGGGEVVWFPDGAVESLCMALLSRDEGVDVSLYA